MSDGYHCKIKNTANGSPGITPIPSANNIDGQPFIPDNNVIHDPVVGKTYGVKYSCDNCGWGGNWRFKNGKRAPAIVVCTKCGCMTAKKMITMPYVPKIAPKTKDSSLPFIRPTWD